MSGYAQIYFGSGYTFDDYINDIVSNSKFKPGIEKFYSSDRILTLSTCYGEEPGRLAVHGVLISVE